MQADGGQQRPRVEIAVDHRRATGEACAAGVHRQRQQPDAALLHDVAVADHAVAGQHPRRTDAGVPGEGQLGGRGEDPHPVVGAVHSGRQRKGGLGQVELAGDGLQLLGGQLAGPVHDGERVAGERAVGEHVHHVVTQGGIGCGHARER